MPTCSTACALTEKAESKKDFACIDKIKTQTTQFQNIYAKLGQPTTVI